MTEVWATNKRTGKKRKFNLISWNLLGKDKGDWVENTSQEVQNSVQKPLPNTGDKTPVSNTTTENKVTKEPEQKVENKKEEVVTQPVFSDEAKNLFRKSTEGLTKSRVKEFFEKQTPPVEYDNKGDIKVLVDTLGEYLKWSVDELAKNF